MFLLPCRATLHHRALFRRDSVEAIIESATVCGAISAIFCLCDQMFLKESKLLCYELLHKVGYSHRCIYITGLISDLPSFVC